MEKHYSKCKEEISITIELEDGEEKDCIIVATPKSEYGSYIALLPKEKEYITSRKILLFKVIDSEDAPIIKCIKDDAEREYANDLLNMMIKDQYYDKLIKKYKDSF